MLAFACVCTRACVCACVHVQMSGLINLVKTKIKNIDN